MSRNYEYTETLKIEPLDLIYEDDMEFLDIEPPPEKEENEEPVKLKRLVCNRNGCTYSTDRRRDLKRHRRSGKHEHEDYQSDSESDVDRSLFTCKVCDYKTAKRFCFQRHKESRRHLMKELEACEQLMDEADRAEIHRKRRKRREEMEPEASDSDVSQENYTTPLKSFQNKKEAPQSLLEPSDYIEYLSQDAEHLVEETEDEYPTFKPSNSTLECDVCEYKTARKFAFVRHLQSSRHLAKMEERDNGYEAENQLEEIDGDLEEFDEQDIHHELEEDINAMTHQNSIEEINTLKEENVMVEIDALEGQNGLGEIGSLVEIDGLDQTEPRFDVIEYAAAEENVYEEIVYLPTEEHQEDICYFIALEQ
ncbi:uncharacterized protein [Drosophila takahashii]|uniref:uncharacterized protein n=1 Tax=Drosophila takahashii TaxID=29030 RepID=UPI001CF92CB7|nr:DNAJ protein JJJ1 homolog [Drosophila takahashii]